jgi:DNA-binding transcriptional LysR family regulator
MNLTQLRFAKAAADERSFTRAAEICNVSQPTLSNAIRLLEDEVKGRIFLRTTRKVELTPFGEELLPYIEAVLHAQTELASHVDAYFNPSIKLVRIGFSPVIDVKLLTQALEPYKMSHPNVEIFYKECFLDDLEERLEKQQIDIMINPILPNQAHTNKFVKTNFYQEDLYYLPKHTSAQPETRERSVNLNSIADDVFVLSHRGCGLADITEALFKSSNIKLKRYSGEALTYQVMQDWADIGIGSVILPKSKIIPDYTKRAMRLLTGKNKSVSMKFGAYWSKAAVYPDYVSALHKHFRYTVPKLLIGATSSV